MPSAAPPDVSVVIPVFNESENLPALAEELVSAFAGTDRVFEVIFVNDASTDDSLAVLTRLVELHPNFRVENHRVNCGESGAQATGFRAARGEIIVTMDADRQNDPADLPMLLDAMTEDVACVNGVRRRRLDSWVKRLSSRAANGFRNAILGEKVADAGCTYRALRRACLGEVLVFNGMHRFLPTMLRLQGFRVIEVPVNHRPRAAGVSKYGVNNRLWRGIRDCLAMRWYRRRVIPGDRHGPNLPAATSDLEQEAPAEV